MTAVGSGKTSYAINAGPLTLAGAMPHVMGVLNVTPDSFSDGGQFVQVDAALRQAERMLDAGAALIDVGGESTRPGATPISENQEIERVAGLIDRLCTEFGCLVSIDTSRSGVMQAAAEAGAVLINDVRALQGEGALQAACDSGLAVCLMHMQGDPQTMQSRPDYKNPVVDIMDWLNDRVSCALSAGIDRSRILIDPGFGFGKTLAHNVALLRGLREFEALGLPLLVGLSRKSMLGEITGKDVSNRLAASLAAALLAAQNGAQIIRVHDVAQTCDALKVLAAINNTQ